MSRKKGWLQKRSTGELVALIVLAALIATVLAVMSGCEGTGEARAAPAPADVGDLELVAQEADSFQVATTWTPVVFQGDTIDAFHRYSARTDVEGYVDVDTVQAIGSELLGVPAPPPGETGEYSYCLRSQNQFGLSSDSTCASYTYTNPDTLPPPPDSVTVEPPVTMTYDSLQIVVAATGQPLDRDTIAVGDSLYLAALLYRNGQVVGCGGTCDSFAIYPGTWKNGVPLFLTNRRGYEPGIEWVAERLPWLRRLGARPAS